MISNANVAVHRYSIRPSQWRQIAVTVQTVENIVKYLAGEEFARMELIPTELYRQADGVDDPNLK